ncbi:hypothetical protein CK203_088837 [Vitis vinifera]|uniref:Uncharacterized protein n=1 Tax=Vitis vinifera TaxID=29760 RepID=A0A438D4Q7_VITVI|nr:hypothetical protein CK203_088837 [Vitis vinifera]
MARENSRGSSDIEIILTPKEADSYICCCRRRRRKKGRGGEGRSSIIALLPCGSLSGHFIQLPHAICFGLHGTGYFSSVENEDLP